MTWTNTPNRYGDISQTIHWLSMFLVGSAWLLGFFGDELPKGEIREAGESLHISAGEMIGALLILRLIWLVVSPPPKTIPLPIGKIGRYAAKIVHYSLYALLFGVVATGITLVFAEGEPLKFIGFYEISSPWIKDRAFAHSVKEVHELMAHSLIILATAHAGAALWHHYMNHDDTLKRMLL